MNGSVVLAYDYPVLGAFWTVLFIVVAAMWLVLLFRVVADIFRDHTLGGLGKTAWLICVLFLPFLGVFLYLIARGDKMSQHEIQRTQAMQEGSGGGPPATRARGASDTSTAELAELADLKAHGNLSDAEYERAKQRILH